MELIRMVVIGFGGMGSRYAKMIAGGEISGMKLTGICCRNQAGQAKIRELYPEVTIYQNADDTFAHADDFDAVLIVTPHSTHAEIGRMAFAHGKHVLCDKPAGITAAEVRGFVDAKQADTAFAMMFNNRVLPAFHKAKEMLDAGELGNITRVIWTCNNWFRSHYYHQSAPWRSSWTHEAGGLLINQTQHYLDIWQWMFGMPDVIDADMDFGKYNDFAVDDGADIRMIYRKEAGKNALGEVRRYPGLRGSILSSSGEHPGVNRLEIWGNKGCMTITGGKLLTIDRNLVDIDTFHRENREIFAQPEHEKEILIDVDAYDPYPVMLQNFSDHILKGVPLVADGKDGLNAIMLTNAAYLSGWTEEKVALPFDDEVYLKLLDEHIAAEKQ